MNTKALARIADYREFAVHRLLCRAVKGKRQAARLARDYNAWSAEVTAFLRNSFPRHWAAPFEPLGVLPLDLAARKFDRNRAVNHYKVEIATKIRRLEQIMERAA